MRLKKILFVVAFVVSFAALPGGQANASNNFRAAAGDKAVKDHYIVVLKDQEAAGPSASATSDNLAKRYGGKLTRKYEHALKGFTAAMSEEQAKKLAADPAVKYVEQDAVVKAVGTQTNPPSWGLDRIDQRNLPLNNSYTYPNEAGNVTVYVLDTGIRISHQDFGGRASNGYDFIDSDPIANDCNGHGTHVAGTVGGTQHGVAKNVRLVGVRVLDCSGNGTWAGVISGIDWVTSNRVSLSVANMSIGGPANTAVNDAIRRSIAAGVVYSVAAGNDNADACTRSPSSTAEAITVGNVMRNDARYDHATYGSNYGSCLDIWAPGTDIVSAHHPSDTATATMTGTSMAAPHVAGAAAILRSAQPTLTPQQVRDVLVNDATNNVLTGINAGSPNKLLFVTAGGTIPPPPPPPANCGPFTNGTNVNIRDFSTAWSNVAVSGCTGTASSTSKVFVDIKHTYRGDLRITLVAPDGTQYLLKQTSPSDAADNVLETYTVNLASEQRNGTWQLRVYDNAWNDIGYLDTWSLTL